MGYKVINPKQTMGKCVHGIHDPTTWMEQDGCHFRGSPSILQVGKYGSN